MHPAPGAHINFHGRVHDFRMCAPSFEPCRKGAWRNCRVQGDVHPFSAPNKTLISDTVVVMLFEWVWCLRIAFQINIFPSKQGDKKHFSSCPYGSLHEMYWNVRGAIDRNQCVDTECLRSPSSTALIVVFKMTSS